MTTFLKTTTTVCALLLSTAISSQAFAARALGVLDATQTVSTETTGGDFNDLFNFNVHWGNNGTAIASTSVNFADYGAKVASVSLYAGTFANFADLIGLAPVASGVATPTGIGAGATVNLASLAVGAISSKIGYTLVISGTSAQAANYSTVFAAAPAVPEATTWAMMLAGFGAIGYTMRRKKAVLRFA